LLVHPLVPSGARRKWVNAAMRHIHLQIGVMTLLSQYDISDKSIETKKSSITSLVSKVIFSLNSRYFEIYFIKFF